MNPEKGNGDLSFLFRGVKRGSFHLSNLRWLCCGQERKITKNEKKRRKGATCAHTRVTAGRITINLNPGLSVHPLALCSQPFFFPFNYLFCLFAFFRMGEGVLLQSYFDFYSWNECVFFKQVAMNFNKRGAVK